MKRSKFSLSNTKLLSCDMGELVPVGLTEVLPGDSIQQNTLCMVRASPLLSPVMHNCHVSLSHWFVPHRLVWPGFEDFITGGPLGTDATARPTVSIAVGGVAIGSLADYLGVPTGAIAGATPVSALPFRGYSLIWNEWFRDQDLQTELVVSLANGADVTTNVALQRVCWEKDYLTSSRPWEQKGPAITIPLGTTAPVLGSNDTAFNVHRISAADEGNLSGVSGVATVQRTSGNWSGSGALAMGSDTPPHTVAGMSVDLSAASAITVNLLREALALQRFEEARARFGSRYVEYLRYLGVRSSDARLQRPEFLGGGRYPIQFSEVLQTAEGANAVGTMRGHGIGVAKSNRYRRFFEEHGYIYTMMYVRPKTIYIDSLPKTWSRPTKEDYFQKELQHIGQQAVLNKEAYFAHTTPDGTFGYQDRYDEYRRAENTVAGEFRTTLNFWHFARDFAANPALNATFVSCVPSEIPFAVPASDNLYVLARHSIQARRIVAASGQSYIY